MRTSPSSPRAWALALSTLLVLPAAAAAAQEVEPEPVPRVVVAVIDSPPNPYHEYFNASGSLYGETGPSSVTPDVLDEFGIDENHIIHITRTGNFTEDFAEDKDQFDAIKLGEPYWFEGKQWAFSHPAVDIITTSYGPPGSPPLGYHLNDA